ncbi:MAG: hypothetical protein M3032_08140 [Verrucomicrobiota bacterium]|nr:hypothetical protein [Verrucomicrobiota bacterium]
MAEQNEPEKAQPKDAGNPTLQDRESVQERVKEGQEKATRHGVEPAPPEPKTI